ncbi:TPA: type II toxin-antitoxin system RelE/ParE family toxin [Escherichia coli]|nr:type II toxin-antitoxin system RelE/ParE family toxin [Escherichia coli]
MTTEIMWTPRAIKDLRVLPARDQKSLREKVNAFYGYPKFQNLDIKKLTDSGGEYRLRVNHYRVRFTIEGGQIVVIRILRIQRRTSTTY